MDTSTVGKVLRIALIVVLASIIAVTLGIVISYAVVSFMDNPNYVDHSVDMPFVYRIICFLPVCTLSIISIIFVSLQTKRIITLEKIVMRADDIPNSYRFTPPSTTKSKRPLVIKILILSVLAFILLISLFGFESAVLRIVLEIILNPNVPASQQTLFTMNIVIMALHALLFVFIGLATILGGASVFIGGRSAHVDELEKVLIQKSNYAELRAQEENDELDELSQIF